VAEVSLKGAHSNGQQNGVCCFGTGLHGSSNLLIFKRHAEEPIAARRFVALVL